MNAESQLDIKDRVEKSFVEAIRHNLKNSPAAGLDVRPGRSEGTLSAGYAVFLVDSLEPIVPRSPVYHLRAKAILVSQADSISTDLHSRRLRAFKLALQAISFRTEDISRKLAILGFNLEETYPMINEEEFSHGDVTPVIGGIRDLAE
ncbi:MAG: hypothetical protein LBH01_02070 [Verrucomicrobiales bacterium]|jgi:hypothetical protein|nr:hypothetical protein [Verrucomicrobiales bacterium]